MYKESQHETIVMCKRHLQQITRQSLIKYIIIVASYFEIFDHILDATLPEAPTPTPTSAEMHLHAKVWRCKLRSADDILDDNTVIFT